MVMGINRLPELRDYWSQDPKLHNTFIASRITRDRFEEITHYLHFVNNDDLPSRDQPGYHHLQKVLPILNALKTKFLRNYNPHPQNTVDEAMVAFKGIQYKVYAVNSVHGVIMHDVDFLTFLEVWESPFWYIHTQIDNKHR